MTSRTSVAKKAAVAIGAAVLLAVSVPLWTSASYVVPRGASMEPKVSNGDLTVVRAAGTYRVGDVAAYRNTALHRVVVHRIVAVDGDVYTFKGDANSFADPQQVRREQIVGRLAISLPLLGGVLLWLTHPVNALLLLAVAVLLVRDRRRLLDLARPAAVAAEAVQQSDRGLFVDDDRLVAISDMSFPHELAVAEVVRPESLLKLAERYDRPVLHDETTGVLFVVESSMLFRCVLEAAAQEPAPLSIVRDAEEVPEPPAALPAALDVVPAPAEHIASGPRTERERRHNWPSRTQYGGRRKPSPSGRDWAYRVGN